ncbi:MAG: protoheme IX farnesyltransferase [Bacteroidetes bacterium]|nr:MAG: protoheme IX farnesyltransferase [Bacteroidota bacterium]
MLNNTLIVNQLFMKIKQYAMLLKFRLSITVVFSGAFGYLLAPKTDVNWIQLLAFAVGSFLITGAANTINQIIEKDLDKLMKRTEQRPLPTQRLSVNEAVIYTLLLAIIGTTLLVFFINVLVASLALFSLLLYGFIYTPLKQKTSISVFVGAFPGAFPPLIGWVAATGNFSLEAFIIFGIQFIWQFPHFWAIAWVADEDYTNAGFKMLPSAGGKDWSTAFQIMIYTLFLIPLGLLPTYFGITGMISGMVATFCGLLFLLQSIFLLKNCDRKEALKMMFASFLYLPTIQIAYLMDKI